MITPQFSVSQDDEFVFISIKAPHIRAANIEFVVDDNVFIFSLHPYYLRLRFPGSLLDEDERSSANYDLSTSLVAVKVPKATPGETFEDLDMISKLLARKNEPAAKKPLIQELEPTIDGTSDSADVNRAINNEAQEFDWEIEQGVPQEPVLGVNYGFDDGYSGSVGLSVLNGNDINDLDDCEKATRQERSEQRRQAEEDKFDADYYLADLFDNPDVDEFIRWQAPELTPLTAEENDRLAKLATKTYLLSRPKQTYIGLVSLVFAACYDYRANLGDSTVESAWAIGKLSPLLSCLDCEFSNVKELMVSCSRRALAFPLYRHWGLVTKVWQDVYTVLKQGKRGVLKILVRLMPLFETDLYNVYNEIWLKDYAVWIQYASDSVLDTLASEVQLAKLVKEDLKFELDELEEAAREAIREGEAEES